MRKLLLLIVLFACSSASLAQEIEIPAEKQGYEDGDGPEQLPCQDKPSASAEIALSQLRAQVGKVNASVEKLHDEVSDIVKNNKCLKEQANLIEEIDALLKEVEAAEYALESFVNQLAGEAAKCGINVRNNPTKHYAEPMTFYLNNREGLSSKKRALNILKATIQGLVKHEGSMAQLIVEANNCLRDKRTSCSIEEYNSCASTLTKLDEMISKIKDLGLDQSCPIPVVGNGFGACKACSFPEHEMATSLISLQGRLKSEGVLAGCLSDANDEAFKKIFSNTCGLREKFRSTNDPKKGLDSIFYLLGDLYYAKCVQPGQWIPLNNETTIEQLCEAAKKYAEKLPIWFEDRGNCQVLATINLCWMVSEIKKEFNFDFYMCIAPNYHALNRVTVPVIGKNNEKYVQVCFPDPWAMDLNECKATADDISRIKKVLKCLPELYSADTDPKKLPKWPTQPVPQGTECSPGYKSMR